MQALESSDKKSGSNLNISHMSLVNISVCIQAAIEKE
jgi:hypothetical protein